MSTPIKPCPWFNHPATINHQGSLWWVTCDERVCGCGPARATEQEAIAAWNAAPRATAPASNTVRVRVAVSVSAKGSWGAAGGSNPDFDPVDALRDTDDYTDAHRLTWIVADVPKPEPAAEIEAEIEP